MKDYAAVCLALFITGAAWWIIREWLEHQLYQDYLRQLAWTDTDFDAMMKIFK